MTITGVRCCGAWYPASLLAAHYAADHGDLTPPDPSERRWPFPPAARPEDYDADRESDRLDHITERRLP